MGLGFNDMDSMGYEYDFGEIPADFSPDPYAEEPEPDVIPIETEDEELLVKSIDYDEFF
ncbi:MAG: hypothetical protein ACOYKJ_01230 [Candidatus Howiella sp.]|jgi:hypothetical protein